MGKRVGECIQMNEIFDMGKYGLYVWPSYALFVGLILHMVISPLIKHKKILRELKQIQRRSE
ncbi:MAG: heme exporter protein CcmD, partial [bacterium]